MAQGPVRAESESGDGSVGVVGEPGKGMGGRALEARRRQTFWLLIAAQIIILSCDVIMTTLLYLDLFLARLAIMGFIYAVKLNIEFLVLNRLVDGARKDFAQSLRDEGIVVDAGSPTASKMSNITGKGKLEVNLRTKDHVCPRTESTAPILGPVEGWPNGGLNAAIGPVGDGEGDLGVLRTETLYRYGSEGEENDLERGKLDETEKRYLGRYKA
jgi:hypothetical protein